MKYEVKNLNELREASRALSVFLLEKEVPRELAFDSRLIISELAANVLKHSRSVARIEAAVLVGQVVLTVHAEDGSLPPEFSVCSEVTAESGRGLFLVDKLSAKRLVTEDGGVRVIIEL